MKRGGLIVIGVAASAGLLAVVPANSATAQDDQIEAAIGQVRSDAALRELRAQASAEPPRTDDRQELSVFHHQRGMANYRLGKYDRAVEDLRLALENNQPGRPAPAGWGSRTRIQFDLASAYEQRGDRFSELDFWMGVAEEYRGSSPGMYHWAQLRLMHVHGLLGQWAESEKARQEAEATLLRMRSADGWETKETDVMRQHNRYLAYSFIRQGNYPEAERRLRSSVQWAEKWLDTMRRVHPEGHQAIRGALQTAGVTKRDLSEILSTQGRYGEAESFARAGLEDALALYGFNTTAIGHALASIAWARFQQGDIAGSEKYRRYALAAMESARVAQHSIYLAATRAALANVLVVQGRWGEALKLFEKRDRGLRSDAAQFKRFGSRHVSWAYALHKTGEARRAAEMAERLIANQLKKPVPDRWYVAQLRGVMGMTLAASGNTADALRAYQQSVPDVIRRDQDDVAEENTGFWRAFWQQVILEGYLDLLAKFHTAGEAPSNLDIIEETFRIADIARGSIVQEAITATAARARLPDRNLAELARREQDALNRIAALNQSLMRLAAAARQETLDKSMSDMRAEIERLRNERAALRAGMRRQYPEYVELIDPKPAGIGDVRKALFPGEALVAIYLGESQSYVWTVGTDGKAFFRVVPLRRDEIESEVRALRRSVDFTDGNPARLRPFDISRAHKLYHAFFEAGEALWRDARVLNVIPHGALGQLPFGLLVTARSQQAPGEALTAYRDVPWLTRKVAIAHLPSASAFVALRRAPSGRAERQQFIGFGDPLFTDDAGAGGRRGAIRSLAVRKDADRVDERLDAAMRGVRTEQRAAASVPALSRAFALLSALPDTSDELREIAAVLKADLARDVHVNRQATEKNVKQARLEDHRVVAFATHGIAPGELAGLDQPALVLSNPALTGDSDNDGFLTMEEVLGLKLDADWVVLSACNTASADGRGSEAVSGLGRAFFYAGARSLLVSNWAVETTSARLLTTELFRRQSENPALTRAEALRQSMLALMEKDATDAGGKRLFSYAHPAFWAPFSLVGDGGR